MSSSETGKKELLDLREDIIDPILGEFSQEIVRGDIQIDNRFGGIPGDKIIVSANKNWLAIVYRNLLSNAISNAQFLLQKSSNTVSDSCIKSDPNHDFFLVVTLALMSLENSNYEMICIRPSCITKLLLPEYSPL